MRLLDTQTKILSEFLGKIPPYAILSHVWETEEVTFPDIADLPTAQKKKGFTKIAGACKQAIKDGLQYIWIDTCCINKDSSAELSEAINSMFIWYKNSAVCYAYLYDVPSDANHSEPFSFFAMSRWFTRGWTLQELLAPLRVVFYGADWVNIGTKATLQEVISGVTGIEAEVIIGGEYSSSFHLEGVPVAVKMSWAAERSTTREEDLAYCLLGLFGVNMPLLYGEGRNAFIRLQHEIIKKSDDHSIFAWAAESSFGHKGILAHSPAEFRNSGQVERIRRSSRGGDGASQASPYFITNRGLQIEFPLVIAYRDSERTLLVPLNCCFAGNSEAIHISIRELSPGSNQYVRSDPLSLRSDFEAPWRFDSLTERAQIYIKDDHTETDNYPEGKGVSFLVRAKAPAEYGELQHKQLEPSHCWKTLAKNEWKYSDKTEEDYDQGAVLIFENTKRRDRFAIILGSREPENMVWSDVLTDIQDEDAYDIWETYLVNSSSRWDRKRRFLDQSSGSLSGQWIVTVTSGATEVTSSSGEASRLHAEIEIKRGPKSKAPSRPLKRPADKAKYLVIVPAPQHGFDASGIKTIPGVKCVQHQNAFMLYANEEATLLLPFTNAASREEFYLLLGLGTENGEDWFLTTSIESSRPDDLEKVLDRRGKTDKSYSEIIGGGKLVFVTIRVCRDPSVADYLLNVSM